MAIHRLLELNVQKYERYLPTAFDPSLSLLEKVNKIIEFVNLVIETSNAIVDLTDEQNKKIDDIRLELVGFKEDIENNVLPANLEIVLDEWFVNGKLAEIINTNVFDMKADKTQVYNIEANPMDFGAIGDGNTDDSAIIQSLVNQYTKVVFTNSHKINTTINVPSDRVLKGKGGKLYGVGLKPIFKINGSRVSVEDIQFYGMWNNTFGANEYLIFAQGIDNGYQIAPTFIRNINIKNCEFNNAQNSGVRLQFIDTFDVSNNKFQNMGYAGVEVLSCKNGTVLKNRIDYIFPGAPVGTGVNAYGIYFSNHNTTDTIRHPHTTDCVADGNYISNSPWEGIDTHGGKNLKFINNIIDSTVVGFAIVSIDGEQSVPLSATKNIHIENNLVMKCQFGVSMDTPANLYHENIQINNNIFRECVDDSAGAGVQIRKVKNANVQNNTFEKCRYIGVSIRGDVINGVITNNTFLDMYTNSPSGSVKASAIFIRENNFSGVISNNTSVLTGAVTATKLNNFGLNIELAVTGLKFTGGNNHFDECTERPYYLSLDQMKNISTPTVQYGRVTFKPDTTLNKMTSIVTLNKKYSGASYFDPYVSFIIARDMNIGLEAIRNSETQFTITIYTLDKTNFTSTLDVLVSWMTVGV